MQFYLSQINATCVLPVTIKVLAQMFEEIMQVNSKTKLIRPSIAKLDNYSSNFH